MDMYLVVGKGMEDIRLVCFNFWIIQNGQHPSGMSVIDFFFSVLVVRMWVFIYGFPPPQAT